jgi:hypothetical protein
MTSMKSRFIDSPHLIISPVMRRFFMRAGGAIRTTARRSLKNARRMRPGELSPEARRSFEWKNRMAAAGLGPAPVLPQITSEPGKPPLLHQKPTSLLKSRLFFALAPSGDYVVIGPEQVGTNKRLVREGQLSSLEELERRRPFMEPAYEVIEPRLPGYLAGAAR